jgi:hypothetical protein
MGDFKMKRHIIWLCTVLVLVSGQAFAYGYKTCLGEKIKWSGNSKTLRGSTTSFPAGYWRNGLQDAVNKFNLNPSKFRYSLTTDGNINRNNGQSEVWGDTGSILQGAPAIAYSWWTCYWFFGDNVHMDEVDVIFDYGSPWTWTADTVKTSLSNYTGSLRPLQTTAAHEFGHGLKINHVNYEYNIMGNDWEHIHVNGSSARAYIGEDASDGAVFLYGTISPAFEDVGVVHWKYSGASGEYSNHTKTRAYNSSGGNLPTFTVNGETGYRVSPGQTVRAEFSYENNGASYQGNVKVGYFISTNDFISTWDQRIGGSTFTLARNQVYTTTKTLTIPSDLSTNTNYWLGVVVDETDSISEGIEWNNATYLPIRVQ